MIQFSVMTIEQLKGEKLAAERTLEIVHAAMDNGQLLLPGVLNVIHASCLATMRLCEMRIQQMERAGRLENQRPNDNPSLPSGRKGEIVEDEIPF